MDGLLGTHVSLGGQGQGSMVSVFSISCQDSGGVQACTLPSTQVHHKLARRRPSTARQAAKMREVMVSTIDRFILNLKGTTPALHVYLSPYLSAPWPSPQLAAQLPYLAWRSECGTNGGIASHPTRSMACLSAITECGGCLTKSVRDRGRIHNELKL